MKTFALTIDQFLLDDCQNISGRLSRVPADETVIFLLGPGMMSGRRRSAARIEGEE
ncbi:hypothetical protein [Rhodopseudomonas sp. B29]|uniref:hypothetical protein n=1 Tax=Rhodopseudomonas sp. B29 TaxID=95607 RepID=UPI00131F45D3|nr:hypothetical protein [Rhodopseudomonas sp. B29]